MVTNGDLHGFGASSGLVMAGGGASALCSLRQRPARYIDVEISMMLAPGATGDWRMFVKERGS